MQDTMKIGAAAIGGYVLGRTKKAKAAMGLALWLAGRRRPRDLARDQAVKLLQSKRGQELIEQVRGPVVMAARSAAMGVFESQANRLTDNLQRRTEKLGTSLAEGGRQLTGGATEQAGRLTRGRRGKAPSEDEELETRGRRAAEPEEEPQARYDEEWQEEAEDYPEEEADEEEEFSDEADYEDEEEEPEEDTETAVAEREDVEEPSRARPSRRPGRERAESSRRGSPQEEPPIRRRRSSDRDQERPTRRPRRSVSA